MTPTSGPRRLALTKVGAIQRVCLDNIGAVPPANIVISLSIVQSIYNNNNNNNKRDIHANEYNYFTSSNCGSLRMQQISATLTSPKRDTFFYHSLSFLFLLAHTDETTGNRAADSQSAPVVK